MSRITISIELVRALSQRGVVSVVGVKDSTGDLASLAMARELPGLSIFTGDDRVLPSLVAARGAGLIGGMPNPFAEDIVALYRSIGSAEQRALAAKAAERIARVDAEGGLIALKANLARKLDDSAWARAMPPLVSALENKADAA